MSDRAKIEERTFDYAIEIWDIKEAELIAKEMRLKKEQIKICIDVRDIAGQRFPTNKLLFIMPELHYEAKLRGILINRR